MPSPKGSVWKGWLLFLGGICMGAADLVPGVSGGTIAFIMGFYQDLLEGIKSINLSSINLLLRGRFKEFSHAVAWRFLLTLGAGIVVAFIVLSHLFHFLLEHETYRIYFYATFFGLILASFAFCIRQIEQWKSRYIVGIGIGIVAAYLLSTPTFSIESEGEYAVQIHINIEKPAFHKTLVNYDDSQHILKGLSPDILKGMLLEETIHPTTKVFNSQGHYVGPASDIASMYPMRLINGWLVVCGAIAICALLLPGISGSYLLTVLGVYPLIIGALTDFISALGRLSLDREAFFILFSLGIGIVFGLLVFARVVSALLRKYRSWTLSVLCGFMIGALPTVWPFWTYAYALMPLRLDKGPQLQLIEPIWLPTPSPVVYQALMCALAGFVVVVLIEWLAKSRQLLSNTNFAKDSTQ